MTYNTTLFEGMLRELRSMESTINKLTKVCSITAGVVLACGILYIGSQLRVNNAEVEEAVNAKIQLVINDYEQRIANLEQRLSS